MTKVTIISGFLGAGKTTLIKKMLKEVFAGQKIVLIENEFGEIGIDGGFLKDIKGQWKYDQNGMLMPCPKCHEKRISGPGSFVEVPIPIEGQPDLHDPVGMLSVDRASLDYTTDEDARLREAIITAIVKGKVRHIVMMY